MKDTETANCSEVERAYTDTTDGAPAFNTLPGPLASKHAVKSSKKLPDAYSTTANLEKPTLEAKVPGVYMTNAYHEVRFYPYWAA